MARKRKYAYALIRYIEDNVHQVCLSKKLKKKRKQIFAKWLDGKSYRANIITTSNCKRLLEDVMYNMENEWPKIILDSIQDINIVNKINIIDNDAPLYLPEEEYVEENMGLSTDINIVNKINIIHNDDVSLYSSEEEEVEESMGLATDINIANKINILHNNDVPLHLPEEDVEQSMGLATGSTSRVMCNLCNEEVTDLNDHLLFDHNLASTSKDRCRRRLFETENKNENLDLCMLCGAFVMDIFRHIKKDHANEEVAFHLDGDEIVSEIGKKSYPTKSHFCIFCKSLNTKLSRHLEIKHKNEDDVKKALSLPKNSLERKKAFLEIQKKGDFYYNKIGTEPILVRRNHKTRNEIEHYIPCPYCKGFYSKNNLRHHIRLYCKKSPTTKKNVLALSRATLPKIHEKANDVLKTQIFPRLCHDEVVKSIAYDEIAIAYANMLTVKFGSSKHFFKMIRQRIRHVGRILLQMRNIAPEVITNVASIFDPAHIDIFIKAVHNLAGLKDGKYSAPTLATTSCTLIAQLGKVLICESIKKNDEFQEKAANKFLLLLQHSMNAFINKTAIENRTEKQRQKVISLPDTEKVKKLYLHLDTLMTKCIEQLNIHYQQAMWITLSKATLVSVMIFNRKRPGDIEKARILEYKNIQQVEQQIVENLNEKEKHYARAFSRFVCRGKLDKPAPVLISVNIKKAIDVLLKYRLQAGVQKENPYLFGTPDKLTEGGFFSASKALKDFCMQLNLPNNITATNLRKHVATITYNLSQGEKIVLSDFLGHAFTIHENIYRQVPVTRDVIEVGNMLTEAMGLTQESDSIGLGETLHIEEDKEIMQNDEFSDEDTTLNVSEVENVLSNLSTIREEPNMVSEHVETNKKRERLFPSNFISASKRTWMTPEKKCARDVFKFYIENKKVPSTKTIQRIATENISLQRRTIAQIQSWIVAEIRRNSNSKSKRVHSWSTPERTACRTYFAPFYKTKTYPNQKELEKAISNIAELKNTTPSKLKSHLQHDYKYLEIKKMLLE